MTRQYPDARAAAGPAREVYTAIEVGAHEWLAMHRGGGFDPRLSVLRGTFAPGSR